MRVYIGCFGSGLGHASRMLDVAEELRARGSVIEMSSSGEVASLIEGRGFRCNRLPLADVKYSDLGEFQVKETLLASPSVLWRTLRQLVLEVKNIGRFGADVVLSDSALSTVLASRILRRPVFTVLNQLNLTSTHGESGPLSTLLSVGTSAGMGKLWELSNEVLLPDLPPPYTLSERNLWGSNVQKTRYVGFLAAPGSRQPDEAAKEFMESRHPRVFWQVSGPPATRTPLIGAALSVAKELREKYMFVISAGDPSTSTAPSRIEGGWFYGWCPIADFYFGACDLVISRAGHGTVGQAITAAKPSLLVPIPKQPEQEGNAEKAHRLGVSLILQQQELSPATVSSSIDSLLNGGYAARAAEVAKVAQSFNGRQEVVRTVEAAS